MVNNVILVGRLTKDIELKKTQSNVSVCRFTLACNRRYVQANGQQEADFISCIAWRQSADFLAQYARKGYIVGVEGRIQTGSYENNGIKTYTTDVVCEHVQLIGNNKKDDVNVNKPVENTQNEETNTPTLNIESDDLPFY